MGPQTPGLDSHGQGCPVLRPWLLKMMVRMVPLSELLQVQADGVATYWCMVGLPSSELLSDRQLKDVCTGNCLGPASVVSVFLKFVPMLSSIFNRT